MNDGDLPPTPTMNPEYTILSRELKPIVWVLCAYNDGVQLCYCTGFCVGNSFIMTCAHSMDTTKYPNLMFKARRLDEENFIHHAIVVSQNANWDITLLRLEGEVEDCKPGILGSGSIDVGDSLITIGHSYRLAGSFAVGYCSYKCIADVSIPIGNDSCFNYDAKALSSTPPYRVLGHVLNRAVFANVSDRTYIDGITPYGHMHPLVPILQCKQLSGGPGGSGSPVFNTKGEIVGMYVYDSFGYYIAIHVSLLKQVLRNALHKLDLKRQAEMNIQDTSTSKVQRKD